MKTLIILGILLMGASVTVTTDLGISATWMSTTGIIFLLGALAVSRKVKILTYLAVVLMAVLFLGGLVGGMWFAHPLGAILNIATGIWVAYRLIKDKRNKDGDTFISAGSNLFQKLSPSIKQNIKWVSVPFGILIALALTKSILIAFIVGAGIVAFLDKQLIKEKGLNRVVILLILYTTGFYFLIVGTYKLTSPYSGIFYNMGDIFFDSKAEEFLWRITPQGL